MFAQSEFVLTVEIKFERICLCWQELGFMLTRTETIHVNNLVPLRIVETMFQMKTLCIKLKKVM